MCGGDTRHQRRFLEGRQGHDVRSILLTNATRDGRRRHTAVSHKDRQRVSEGNIVASRMTLTIYDWAVSIKLHVEFMVRLKTWHSFRYVMN